MYQFYSVMTFRNYFEQSFGSVVHHPAFTCRCTALPFFQIVLKVILYTLIVFGIIKT